MNVWGIVSAYLNNSYVLYVGHGKRNKEAEHLIGPVLKVPETNRMADAWIVMKCSFFNGHTTVIPPVTDILFF